MKPIVYVDMDGVLADYEKKAIELGYDFKDASHHEGFFLSLEPIKNSIESFYMLSEKYDMYILTAASWTNPISFAEKIEWVKKYIPDLAHKRVIFSNDKSLLKGDYLIDDRDVNKQSKFVGEWLKFGSDRFPDWKSVTDYLMEKEI